MSRLCAEDFAQLEPFLEPVQCALAVVLADQDADLAQTYFLDSGVASLVPISPQGRSSEGGVVGREGYIVPATILGSKTTPYKIEIQMAGAGHCISSGALLAASDASTTLRNVLLRFAHVLMVQMTYSVLANAVHHIDERLARWLLMRHDRSDGDDLALTHNLMAVMLSVRRSSVTSALHGCIRADRGSIIIRDRAALEIFAGDSYGKPEREYRRLLGTMCSRQQREEPALL